MAYIKPGSNRTGSNGASSDSDYLAIDFHVPDSDTGAASISATGNRGVAIEASAAGFGYRDPYTGSFEVLDALPLKRQAVQEKLEAAGIDINFATQDFVTATEADTLRDSELILTDLT